MGYKTRSNYALGYSMTDEEFNKVFERDQNADIKFEKKEERKRKDNSRNLGKESEVMPRQEGE